MLRRGDRLVLARLDRAAEYHVNAGETGPRGFAGAVQAASGLELYFTESAAETTRDGQATVTLHRLPAIGGAPVPVVAYSFFGRFATESASVSADGRLVAYSSVDGLHVRDLLSGDDRLVVASPCQPASGAPASEPRPAVGFGGCQWVDVSPLWSPDARQLIFRRLYIEGSRWHSVDPLAPSGVPLAMPWQFYRAWAPSGVRVCAVDGDGYAVPPTTAFAYDFATSSARWLAVSPADIRPQRIVTGCALSRVGQMAVTYGDYSRSASRLVMSTERFDVERSFDTVGEVDAWLPDASGVVLRDAANRSADQRPLFYLADRAGGLWSLAVDADEIAAILP